MLSAGKSGFQLDHAGPFLNRAPLGLNSDWRSSEPAGATVAPELDTAHASSLFFVRGPALVHSFRTARGRCSRWSQSDQIGGECDSSSAQKLVIGIRKNPPVYNSNAYVLFCRRSR
jgi:hypothetical protein